MKSVYSSVYVNCYLFIDYWVNTFKIMVIYLVQVLSRAPLTPCVTRALTNIAHKKQLSVSYKNNNNNNYPTYGMKDE